MLEGTIFRVWRCKAYVESDESSRLSRCCSLLGSFEFILRNKPCRNELCRFLVGLIFGLMINAVYSFSIHDGSCFSSMQCETTILPEEPPVFDNLARNCRVPKFL